MKTETANPNSSNSPYLGLIPFTEKDADYFFGRKSTIEVVATNLRATSLTVFYGASGVGKSSLLNAGVVPYLQKIATASILPGEPPEFLLVVIREWANNPMESIRLRIIEAVKGAVGKNKILHHLTLTDVETSALSFPQSTDLCLLLKTWTDLTKTDFLIILDQFEDFFLHPEFASGDGSFGEELPKALNNLDLPVNFMISMRDDAFAKLDFFKGKLPNMTKNTLRLLHLDRDATEEAIRKPLDKYNEQNGTAFKIEDDLVERLLDDLQVDKVKLDMQGQAVVNPAEAETVGPPGESKSYKVETPYLQLVMMRLWKDENTQRDQLLALDTLINEKKLGGVQKIVETHLDDVMDQFDEADKMLASEFIHFTVTHSGTKIPSDVSDLADWAELPENRRPDIERILKKLSTGETRIFKEVPNRRDPKSPFYEVAHDALGPAILSWRKRTNEARLQESARLDEEKKRQKEIEELEAKRQAELQKEIQHKEEQAARLKEEQEKRIQQEHLLAVERRNRKLGRRIWALLAVLTIVGLVLGAYWLETVRKKNSELLCVKKYYEEENESYRSMLEIVWVLKQGIPSQVRVVMNSLNQKAKDGKLAPKYKELFKRSLNEVKISNEDDLKLRDEVLTSIETVPYKPNESECDTIAVIIIHTQNSDPGSQALKTWLEKEDEYLVPRIEVVGPKPEISQVQLRYFHDSDAAAAEKISKLLKGKGIDAEPNPLTHLGNMVRQKEFELWFTNEPIPEIK